MNSKNTTTSKALAYIHSAWRFFIAHKRNKALHMMKKNWYFANASITLILASMICTGCKIYPPKLMKSTSIINTNGVQITGNSGLDISSGQNITFKGKYSIWTGRLRDLYFKVSQYDEYGNEKEMVIPEQPVEHHQTRVDPDSYQYDWEATVPCAAYGLSYGRYRFVIYATWVENGKNDIDRLWDDAKFNIESDVPRSVYCNLWSGNPSCSVGEKIDKVNARNTVPIIMQLTGDAYFGVDNVKLCVDKSMATFDGGSDSGLYNMITVGTDTTRDLYENPLIITRPVSIIVNNNKNTFNPPPEVTPIIISAAPTENPDNGFNFYMYVKHDAENSHNIGVYRHRQFEGAEVPGDGYLLLPDANNNYIVDDDSLPEHYKDVLVEIDWYQWNSYISSSSIDTIANYVKQVLETAGVRAHVYVGGQITSSVPDDITFQDRQTLYASTRHDDNRIHVILGKTIEQLTPGYTALGKTDDYFDPNNMNSHIDYRYCAMNKDIRTEYFDRVGCYVDALGIWNMTTSWSYGDKQLRAVAFVAAHEIGHALGMDHYSRYLNNDPHQPEVPNIMYYTVLAAFNDPDGWVNHAHFAGNSLDGWDNYKGVWEKNHVIPSTLAGFNTRHVLGVSTIYNFEYIPSE